jgi:hypothetical protein
MPNASWKSVCSASGFYTIDQEMVTWVLRKK